ncbi:MAG: ATP-binding protein [Ignavibacteriales bacterium]|nr:ATP-binding protein [Ignavibacteriales bacterium]
MNVEIVENLKSFLNDNIISNINSHAKERLDYLEKQLQRYENWKNEILNIGDLEKIFLETAQFHRDIESSINIEKENILKTDIHKLLENYQNKFDELTKDSQQFINVDQEDFHFKSIESDSLLQKQYKRVKRVSFPIAKGIKRISKGKYFEYHWTRTIPNKGLLEYYFVNNFQKKLLEIIVKYYESIGSLYINILNALKNIDKGFTDKNFSFIKESDKESFDKLTYDFEIKLKDLSNQFIENKDLLNSKIILEFDKLYETFSATYKVIGTVGNPIKKFSEKNINTEKTELTDKIKKSLNHFHIYFDAVFDRIEYYHDLLWFTNLLLSNSYSATNKANEYKEQTVVPLITSIVNEIQNSKINLENHDDDFKSILLDEKKKLTNSLDQKLAVDLINKITNSQYHLHLLEYERNLLNNLNEFEKDYKFVKPSNLNFNINKDGLKEFSPKDIIYPIIIKKLKKVIQEIKSDFQNNISKLNPNIIGLARIVEFNLDSSLSKFTDDNEQTLEAKKIAISGLERAANKVEDINEDLEVLYNKIRITLNNEFKELLEDLYSLSNIERLISVKLQVSKEKAIQEAKDRFQLFITQIVDWIKASYNQTKIVFESIREKVLGISSKVGLSSTDIELSEAMADYLVRVSSAFEKLPYVYKRLFSNDELTDTRIFIGRERELEKFEKAYNYWQNQQISSIMLIGEKGSGTSSLINIALNKLNPPNKVFRRKFHGTIYKESDLLDYLKDLLEIKNPESFEKLIEAINNLDERKIVIVENFEDFFLRVVDGFDSAKRMLEIITSTSKNILWILTCNTFAWNYLDRVMQIKDFFIFNIHFRELEKSVLEEAVLVRHNITGYNIAFIPSPSIEKQKSYKKLDEIEKQKYLQKEYFDRLHKLASNNIGIALFLWLRSIESADEEEIRITTDIELDFSFLSELSDQKLFSIMALILHDGLTVEEHSHIFNLNLKDSQLLFATLSDDGIIFKRGNLFKVNFQLYKPLVNLLRSKNIIH